MGKSALWYAKNGIPVFPLHYSVDGGCSCHKPDCGKHIGKHPLTPNGFLDATTDVAQVKAWWRQWPDANIGMPTGAVTKRIVVDTDPRNGGPEDREEFIRDFGPIPDGAAEVITGGGGRHVHLGWDGGPVPKALAPGFDLKAHGGYVLLPPSLHASGKRYEVDGLNGARALLSPAPAPDWLKKAISAARNGANRRAKTKAAPAGERWPEGERNNRLTSVAGTMRRRGLSHEAIQAALLEENRRRCDPPLPEDEVRTIAASVARYEPGANYRVNGVPPTNEETAGEKVHSSHAEAAGEWPKPEPMQAALPPVDPFPLQLLPKPLLDLVEDVAERMQVPADFPAATVVLCIAGVVSRRATIQPNVHDDTWLVVPNLWGGIVGEPGVLMKSPVIQAIIRPLLQIQGEWVSEHELAKREYELEEEDFKLRLHAWQDLRKREIKGKGGSPSRPDREPGEPVLRRLIVNDCTFEALHQRMSENPAGLFFIRDELTGLLSRLDREEFGAERAFYLSCWNGDTSHTIDRIERGTVHVPHCCLSILGGIQPARLRAYFTDALNGGASDDGLVQRYQVMLYPDMPTGWTLVDRRPNSTAVDAVSRIFKSLLQLNPDAPLRFRFAPDAQGIFVKWRTEMELRIRNGLRRFREVTHPCFQRMVQVGSS
jgi:hypothetical protein